MATKKVQTTAIVKWSDKLAAKAAQETEQNKFAGGGPVVRFGRGTIEVGGGKVPGGALECVVLGYAALNAYYEGIYDPENITPPACYAYSDKLKDPEMTPHADAETPQSDDCASCLKNKFGSAANGRGKACGNKVKLGILVSSDIEDAGDVNGAEMALATVSPTNVKAWVGYVESIHKEHKRPVWSVITEISAYDDDKTQIRLEFRMAGTIDDDAVLDALDKRLSEQDIQEVLQTPFPKPEERAAPAKSAPSKGTSGVGRGKKFSRR